MGVEWDELKDNGRMNALLRKKTPNLVFGLCGMSSSEETP